MGKVSAFLNGAKWNTIGKFYRVGVSALIFFILAKFLTPNEIGIVGMATVFVGFFNLVLNMGFESAIIQGGNVKAHVLDKLWVINLLIGLLLSVLGYFSSSLVSLFYNNSEVGIVFSYLSIIFFISGISIVQRGILIKNLEFKKVAVIEVLANTISGIVGVAMALLNYSYWSIVVQQILLAILNTFGYSIFSGWKPKFERFLGEWNMVLEYLNFSINVLVFNIVNFIAQKADQLLIGKFLGGEQLGIYMLAINIIVMPFSQLTQIFTKTLFPIITKFYKEKELFKKYYLDSATIFFAIVAPFSIIIGFYSEEILTVFFEQKWLGAVPLIPVFCYQILRNSIVSPTGVIFLGLKRPDYQWKYSLFIGLPFRVLGVFVGYYYIDSSALGIAIGFNITASFAFLPGMYLAFRLARIRILEFIEKIKNPFLGALGVFMFGILALVISIPLIKFGITIFSIICYVYFVMYRNRQYYEGIKNLFLKRT